jgi:hypothetical protein
MRMTKVFLGTGLVLCNLATLNVAARAQKDNSVRQSRDRPVIRVPVVRIDPYWDYYDGSMLASKQWRAFNKEDSCCPWRGRSD